MNPIASSHPNSFGARATLRVKDQSYEIFRLDAAEKSLGIDLTRMPFSMKILLENLLRNEDGQSVKREDVEAVASWSPAAKPSKEISFHPARVLLQDFTGVPAVVDLAAMRDAMVHLGGDPRKINPLQPADLVIDHSVQVDYYGSSSAFRLNAEMELNRNRERYEFLRWGQTSLKNFRVVPPDTGIVHQVNLEYLASVIFRSNQNGLVSAYPDTLVGTDSHTTMINGLGVVGWGVGGIEAEAAMLGQPISMLIPEVVGFRLSGSLPVGTTATDLVLTVTQMLRKKGVVGKFVEFYGPGVSSLKLADRATIANMAPEYGATIGLFPVDAETLDYLLFTGRDRALVELVREYYVAQQIFHTPQAPEPHFSDALELDLETVEPSLAGPKRPQDRVPLKESKQMFLEELRSTQEGAADKPAKQTVNRWTGEGGTPCPTVAASSVAVLEEVDYSGSVAVEYNGKTFTLQHGSVVIAAITSCTNTSNPSVMIGAGLLARNAHQLGLTAQPWVKTSLAPGSKVVSDYLQASGLVRDLDAIGFYLVGYGCTTCIGNSGPVPEPIANAIERGKLVVVSVLSGNRNFEGRINPHARFNYLASPPLVVAYAIAGKMDIDLHNEPLGTSKTGKPVFLKDIWPAPEEIQQVMQQALRSEMFSKQYSNVFEGDQLWKSMRIPQGDRFEWKSDSTYIKSPPFFEDMTLQPPLLTDIGDACVLALLGDSVTTDHISPAGSIPVKSPAGQYLIERGVEPKDFNSYGARRGNHEVMMRGTFANIRLRNLLAPGTEGGWTKHLPDGQVMTIYDAAIKYQREEVPLIVIAGKEYGTGSSRDWAAKGTRLLGVKAVIAESFERIHRSNLVGMGVLPLQFLNGENRETLGLTGLESYSIEQIASGIVPGGKYKVRVLSDDGDRKTFSVVARVDTPEEATYYLHGGILQYVLRQLMHA
ncbi:MAG TPA: aconitate hydratase AcnA [Acidobacteriota bacterium]|jgi:aconitate hydratase|nr:aconitate hydratase AcnA [Acidobacteriota bacterium]